VIATFLGKLCYAMNRTFHGTQAGVMK